MVTGATTSAEGFEAFVQAGALADMPGVRTRMPSASVISRVRGCAGCGPHQFVQVRFPLSPPSWASEADGGMKTQGGSVGPGGGHWPPVPPHIGGCVTSVVGTDRSCPPASRIETDTPRPTEHGTAASFQM